MKNQDVAHLPQTQRLLNIMAKLRDPDTGCPWDLKQSMRTIVPYTIEEAYEVADAIEHGDMNEIKDELGDLLFQVVFYAQLGEEQGDFDFEQVAEVMGDKLIRRHPHVFADEQASTDTQVLNRWEQIKQQERAEKGLDADTSALANIAKGMAPLMRAHKLQKKCAKVGFDWPKWQPVVDKIKEEIDEVVAEVEAETIAQDKVEEEVGDLLFAVVNLARHLNVDSETALRKANYKFEQRFRAVEQELAKANKSPRESNLEEMEALWIKVKRSLKPT